MITIAAVVITIAAQMTARVALVITIAAVVITFAAHMTARVALVITIAAGVITCAAQMITVPLHLKLFSHCGYKVISNFSKCN